jgi:transcriptional regulator with GAF, ATPase, and Fis domain
MATERPTRTLHRAAVIVDPLSVVLRPKAHATPAELAMDSGTVTIGSGSRCDLIIDEPTVSRSHVEMTLVPEGVLARDLGSRNGTFYLGQRIASAVLMPGTVLMLGAVPLAIELDTDRIVAGPVLHNGSFRGMTGSAPAMRRLFTTISRLDGSTLPTLVLGETGVGKELVARAIHEGSRVANGPFVTFNCGAVTPSLLASSLFGHKKGAFTGAMEARKGAFAAAHNGTLFLDEIGELPLDVQPALLRAIELGEITAVGEDTPQRVRVRVIAATHRDLPAFVRDGRFRQDLYFRIAVLPITIPPLRERREDIPSLARIFARQEGVADLDDDVIEDLARRDYAGNVRELRNAVLAYVALGILGSPGAPEAKSLLGGETPAARYDVPYLAQRDALVDDFTRKYLVSLLEMTKGNQSEAARIAGLDRSYFGRLVAKLGVLRPRP